MVKREPGEKYFVQEHEIIEISKPYLKLEGFWKGGASMFAMNEASGAAKGHQSGVVGVRETLGLYGG